jgi:hypothetical protein
MNQLNRHQLQINYSQSHDYFAWSNHVDIFDALVQVDNKAI